ncbi:hypothetical protein NDI76_19750 [Halogeometricum sp. S1BR25-6]|uniref:Uncharacterized protein n=1 Tax=Halogeometricum salsisoli TaxID=2950536 RepID=A0ABU2GLA7_9EURY|nr:hypothetical protein [Halogeometricum sp. S1BR25-6]MDS0300984.1 hypothetical protein [Halogeometricum sp. S1BR25-6]
MLEELRGLANADELNEWRDTVRNTVTSAEIPRVEPPAGEGAFPDDPLFDSDRAYEENVVRVQQHKQSE